MSGIQTYGPKPVRIWAIYCLSIWQKYPFQYLFAIDISTQVGSVVALWVNLRTALGRSAVQIQVLAKPNFFFHSFSPWVPDLLLSEGWRQFTCKDCQLPDQKKLDEKIDVTDLFNGKKEGCGPQGLFNIVFCVIKMSVCKFFTCNLNEYIKEITSGPTLKKDISMQVGHIRLPLLGQCNLL